jgi:hypothetical protein
LFPQRDVPCFLRSSFWYGWLYSGTGNANFVYAITLVWQAAQVHTYPLHRTHTHTHTCTYPLHTCTYTLHLPPQTMLVCDVFHSVLRHEYSLTHGDVAGGGAFKDIVGKHE